MVAMTNYYFICPPKSRSFERPCERMKQNGCGLANASVACGHRHLSKATSCSQINVYIDLCFTNRLYKRMLFDDLFALFKQ